MIAVDQAKRTIPTADKPQIVRDFLVGYEIGDIAARRFVARVAIEQIVREALTQTIALLHSDRQPIQETTNEPA